MAERQDYQRDRTTARGVQAKDQDADLAPSAETAAVLFWA